MSLSYNQQSNVIGKAPGKLLKGGLGALGVGQMWFDGDDTDPAYAHVPEVPFESGAMYVGSPPESLGREIAFPNPESLRNIVIDWIEKGFTTPPYEPEVYDAIEWLGITNEDIRKYDVQRPATDNT